jgi:hypothetical protein
LKTLRNAFQYRNRNLFPIPDLSTRRLSRRFNHEPRESVTALLRKTGPFMPARDAFGFTNSNPAWPLTDEDARVLRERYELLVDASVLFEIDFIRHGLTDFSVSLAPFGVIGLPGAAIDFVIDQITKELRNSILDLMVGALPGKYGRCGGMAFAGLDFFLTGWPTDKSPDKPASGDLRDYIFSRLLDSIELNGLDFLNWTTILNVLPLISHLATAALAAQAGQFFGGPIGAAFSALAAVQGDLFHLGGPKALMDNTREHLEKLKTKLDQEAAWPIGIVYKGSVLPIDQHQVLAIGYQEGGDTPLLEIWDNNDPSPALPGIPNPRCMRTLQLNLGGDELSVQEIEFDPKIPLLRPACDNAKESPKDKQSRKETLESLKGIICEDYSYNAPPVSLHLA